MRTATVCVLLVTLSATAADLPTPEERKIAEEKLDREIEKSRAGLEKNIAFASDQLKTTSAESRRNALKILADAKANKAKFDKAPIASGLGIPRLYTDSKPGDVGILPYPLMKVVEVLPESVELVVEYDSTRGGVNFSSNNGVGGGFGGSLSSASSRRDRGLLTLVGGDTTKMKKGATAQLNGVYLLLEVKGRDPWKPVVTLIRKPETSSAK